jgi:hypothetical protein
MKSKKLTWFASMTLLAALAVPIRLAAQVTGSGTPNFIPKWTGSTTLGNSKIVQSGGMVGIDTAAPTATLTVTGPNATTPSTAAVTVLQVTGGKGGLSQCCINSPGGAGAGMQLNAGVGGGLCSLPNPHGGCLLGDNGGNGGSMQIGGGFGGRCCSPPTGGNGGSITLQPGLGGSAEGSGRIPGSPGNIILAPSGGRVAIGTASPAAELYVVGDFIATGIKSALVETASYGKRQLYAVESAENWFEDFGGAQLIHGRATVKLDPIFAETVNTEDEYHVFLTPKGDCKGLYVASQSASSFEVRELRHGKGTIAFDYRVVAKRRGFERTRLAELEDDRDTQRGEMKLAEK